MIHILSDETINQIAAGEVIERPLSIVKELLENSIDAGASSVSIEIRDGGIGLIRISDNGHGIEKSEVRTAFLRHATSKICEASDLTAIHTLGFRGEALASIAAVAKVELITKKENELLASRYIIEGGREKELSEVGAPNGSTIIVRELFYNVPARRKFLKSPATESARIQEIIEKEALAHPEVSFRLSQDGKQKLATLGNGSLLDTIYSIFGREVAGQLIKVEKSYQPSELSGIPGISVRGFIGEPATNRANRNFEIYFVNGRYVKDALITKAVEDGYRAFLMQHKFPFAVLKIDINPELVDVNVHPQKLEVRFADGSSVYNSIVASINEALHETELIVDTDLEELKHSERQESRDRLFAAEPFEAVRNEELRYRYEERPSASLPHYALPKGDIISGSSSELKIAVPEGMGGESLQTSESPVAESGKNDSGIRKSYTNQVSAAGESSGKARVYDYNYEKRYFTAEQLSIFQDRFLSESARLEHRIIGQVFETYWLIEYGDKLFMMDQHAAHEKVNFERMMKRLRDKKPVSQYIEPPLILSLGSEEALLLEKYMEHFNALGYEIREMGGRDFAVSAVPADLPELEKRELLLELISGLSDDTGAGSSESVYDKIASMSCKAAVKGNNRLSMMEAQSLISELMSLENPYACPHGRPTLISMSKQEIEKKFKRIV